MTKNEFLERKKNFQRIIDTKNMLSNEAIEKHSQDMLDFKFDLQLFGKGGGKGGKILFSVLGLALGLGVGFFALDLVGTSLISAGLIGASIGGTIWTATHKPSSSLGDSPSIQRFDKAQESMSSTGSIPVVYGMRKIAGNQTYHKTNAEQNTLYKHVVLCEGGIEGIQSVCANDLLIPTNGQSENTVFTITNTVYKDAKVWKDGKTLHLYCNGSDNAIYLCNKDDAERADTYYSWQTSVDSLISYINRMHMGWQAFPYATTTKYPGDLACSAGYSLSQASKSVPYNTFQRDYLPKTAFQGFNRNSAGVTVGQKITLNSEQYAIVKKIVYPKPKTITRNIGGREYTYTTRRDEYTKPTSYVVDVYNKHGNDCYNTTVSITAATVKGGTSYTFHDCETPSNYEEVGGYPKMAWLEMTFKTSQELNGNPSVDCIVKGKKVYDPRTKTTAYSNNPALCLRDFLLSKRYGLGKWIDEDDLDDDSFIEAANYCDQQITVYDADNNPLKSKRYTLNMVIDQRQDAIKWLQDILGNFAAWLVISRNKIKLLVEKPSPICYKFNDDNLKDMQIVPLKASETPNHYQVTITDPQTNWKNVSMVVDNFADQKERGKIISKEVELSGVTSQAQALRLARYYSDYNLSCPITLSFTTGIEAMALECGDVVSVSYRDAFKNMPIRISTIKETAENEFEISGRQYNPDIYSDDLGGGIQTKNYSVAKNIDENSDYFIISNVKQLEAKTIARKNLDGKTVYDISVTYQLPGNYYIETAQVYYKTNTTNAKTNNVVFKKGVPANELGYTANWKSAGEGISQVTIPNVHIGDIYKIRVVTKTRKGKISDIDSAPEVLCKVVPKSTVPSKPYGLTYDFTREFRFNWQDVADSDVIYYEIRTDKNVGNTEGFLGRTSSPTIAVKLTKRKGTVYVFAVNNHKRASVPAKVEYSYPKLDAPATVTFSKLPRGMRIIVPAFPWSCNKMNVYLTSRTVSDKFTSSNAVYSYMGEPDIYYVRVAYVDLLGEGYASQEYSFTIEPTFPEEWIKDGSLSEKKMDKVVAEALEQARKATTDIVELKQTDESIQGTVANIEKDTASQFTQMADKITSIVTDLNQKDPKKFKYSALSQLQDGINARVVKDDIINQINLTAEGTKIDGKYLHVTGTTQFDKDVITNGMIKAGAVTAEKLSSTTLALTGGQGIKGGAALLNANGMTVTTNNGSVSFDKDGMSFKDKNGQTFSVVGRFLTGTANEGQYVKFTKPWDVVPNVILVPTTMQTGVANYSASNTYTKCYAENVSKEGFKVRCYSCLGSGSSGVIGLNKVISFPRVTSSPTIGLGISNGIDGLTKNGYTATKDSNDFYVYKKTVSYDASIPNTASSATFKISARGYTLGYSYQNKDYGPIYHYNEKCTAKIEYLVNGKVVATDSTASNSDQIIVRSISFAKGAAIRINVSSVISQYLNYNSSGGATSKPTRPNPMCKVVIETATVNVKTESVIAKGSAAFIVTDTANKQYTVS